MTNPLALEPIDVFTGSNSATQSPQFRLSAAALQLPLRRLLCIDSEPDIRQIVQAALWEFQGWSATVADGLDGLDAEAHPPWDAILLEVSKTQQQGFALVSALRSHPCTCHSPIVLLTSQVMARDYARFQQMAVVGVIPKPFDPVTLGSQIATLLGWPEVTVPGHTPQPSAV